MDRCGPKAGKPRASAEWRGERLPTRDPSRRSRLTSPRPASRLLLLGLLALAACGGEIDFSNTPPDARRPPPTPTRDGITPYRLDGGGSRADGGTDLVPPPLPDTGGGITCQHGETPFGGHCYSALGYKWLDYTAAKQVCKSRGAVVVSVESAAENTFIYNLIPRYSWAAFIGLRRNGTGLNDFVWESGKKPTYTRWAKGEPNNDKGIESCVVLWAPDLPTASLRGYWNDAPCSDPGRDTVICERVP